MAKKANDGKGIKKNAPLSLSPSPPEWDPTAKESWHYEFDKEPVNDERWNCMVTTVMQAKPEDEEFIQIFSQCVATGLRRAIKIIKMADVIEILKDKLSNAGEVRGKSQKKSKSDKTKKTEKTGKVEKIEGEKKGLQGPTPKACPIVDLAAKYAIFTDVDCKLPPDLMAGLIKYLILNLKEEDIFWKKVNAVKERKKREKTIKENFIKSLKPFKIGNKETHRKSKGNHPNFKTDPINDEPYLGPDLYIVLIDFYNPFYFPELLKVNVPMVAIFKISSFKETSTGKWSNTAPSARAAVQNKKETLISDFWKKLTDSSLATETTALFKDFLFMQYQPQFLKSVESKEYARDVIFDEISSMLYTTFYVHRQHQTYLQEMFVQRMILSLEPLELSKCTIYNKLCDALVTGDSNTLYLILFAMLEQVVAGVPYTESASVEYEPMFSEYFSNHSDFDIFPGDIFVDSKGMNYAIVTPCTECRDKRFIPINICQENYYEESVMGKGNRSDEKTEAIENFESDRKSKENESLQESAAAIVSNDATEEACMTEGLVDELIRKRKIQNEVTKKKIWGNPIICFYGDKIKVHSYHFDSRFISSESIFSRFLKKTNIPQLWSKYPRPTLEKKAFYNYHFSNFLHQAKGHSIREMKIKMFFVLCMKLMGITKSYLYKGEDENISESVRVFSREKPKKLSKVRFDQRGDIRLLGLEKNASSCLFNVFSPNMTSRKKVTMKPEFMEKLRSSFLRTDSTTVRKAPSLFNVSLVTHRNSGYCFPYFFKNIESANTASSLSVPPIEKDCATLYSLLDCYEISNLTESHMLNGEDDYADIIKNFNFFEILEPQRMVQRLLKAQEDFNTTQCSYFAPTDTLIMIMHNDSDYRGVFVTFGYGTLHTPVGLRDFYTYVYPEINEWLDAEKEEYKKFVTENEEEALKVEEEKDRQYLLKLKREFCAMNEEERKTFLNSDDVDGSPNKRAEEVREEELEDLPIKPKPEYPNRISFVGTNFLEVRTETQRRVQEFHSRDGTEISVTKDCWLYDPMRLLSLGIKQFDWRFLHHRWMEDEIDNMFSLKTTSDINFVFYKENPDAKYRVKMSWPTGLMIQGMFPQGRNSYIHQKYIKPYRNWLDIEKEKARCFLKNGQVLIFKEEGEVEVLFASGTRWNSKEFKPHDASQIISRDRTTSSTGEVWEASKKSSCKSKKKLIDTLKIYMGIDSKAQETFYRRDDGVYCMLWPDGTLVTSFPDGTKITSTPAFDNEEILIEWSEDEKSYLHQIELKYREEIEEAKPKSKAILKKLSPSSMSVSSRSFSESKHSLQNDGFILVSISYLMEHPKYASVSFDALTSVMRVKMPNELSITVHPEESYTINQNNNFLIVEDNFLELYTNCSDCGRRSSATINLDTTDILCKFVNFLQEIFYVYKNGETMYQESTDGSINVSESNHQNSDKNYSCDKNQHIKSISEKQKCFAFERDLSGIEFIHFETLAHQCYKLPQNTYYELNLKNNTDSMTTHQFSSPHSKVGYAKWTMEYESPTNSLPTNLKKRDLKEVGTKESLKKPFRYPFPKNAGSEVEDRNNNLIDGPPDIPKVVVTRIVKCISQNPKQIIDELQGYVTQYQKKAYEIYHKYKKNKSESDDVDDPRHIKMKLKKIALTLNQKFVMYPHVGTQIPSTEKDVHNCGHYINLMDELKTGDELHSENLPQCKQIPIHLPRINNFSPIEEEEENQEN